MMNSKAYTLEEAFLLLLGNTRKWRRYSDITPGHVTSVRNKYRQGALGEQAMRNFVMRSGVFSHVEYFEIKK